MVVVVQASSVLFRLRDGDNVDEELEEIRASVEESEGDEESRGVKFRDLLATPAIRRALFLGCGLMLLQQLSGINIVMFYSSTILTSLHMRATLITALVGIVNCVSVFPTIILFKKFGRKSLLWVFSFAISASLIGLGVCLIVAAQWKEKYGEENAIC